MKLTKEFIEGYCQALIDTNEGLSNELDVNANVYYINLLQCYQVDINWSEAYDNYKDQEVRNYKVFQIEKLKDFGFELVKFFNETLSEVVYNADYDSREAEYYFAEEMKFEYLRGN